METEIKNAYSIIPSKDQVEALHSYFKMIADRQCPALKREYGVIEFIQKDLLKDAMIGRVIGSQSYLSSTMTYLQSEGFIKRLRRSSPAAPALWDVSKFIKDEGSVVTKEDLGMNPYYRRNKNFPDVEIEVVSKEDKPMEKIQEPQVEQVESEPTETPADNTAVLMDINENVSDMIGHLQQLPIAFNSIMKELTSKLTLLDPNVIAKLEEEKQHLSAKVTELEAELATANQKLAEKPTEVIVQPDYNKQYIETQCNGIDSKMADILNAPWKIGKNKESYKQAISIRLENIKKHLGIIE